MSQLPTAVSHGQIRDARSDFVGRNPGHVLDTKMIWLAVSCRGNPDSPCMMPEMANTPQVSKVFGLSLAGDWGCPAESSAAARAAQIVLPRQPLLETGPVATQWLCTWAARESCLPDGFAGGLWRKDQNLNGRCDSMKMKLCFPASSLVLQNSPASLSSKHDEKKTCHINSHAHRVKDHAVFTVKFEDELVFEIPSV